MKLNKFAYLYSKPLGNHTLKNIEKNTWKFTKKTWKNHGNIMKFCLSEKVGTLSSLHALQLQLFFGGGRGRGYSWVVKSQSAKFWPTFIWGGGGYSWVVKTQSAKFWPTFSIFGSGGRGLLKNRVFLQNGPTILEA